MSIAILNLFDEDLDIFTMVNLLNDYLWQKSIMNTKNCVQSSLNIYF